MPGLTSMVAGFRSQASESAKKMGDAWKNVWSEKADLIDAKPFHDSATELAGKAKDAWDKASAAGPLARSAPEKKEVVGVAKPKNPWAAFEGFKTFSGPSFLGTRGFDPFTNSDRALKFGETVTAGGLIRKPVAGVSGPAYGLVRRGQARAERDWIEQQKKAEAEKAKNTEGTNARLDKTNELLEDVRDELGGG
jgi:hypothetical protein